MKSRDTSRGKPGNTPTNVRLFIANVQAPRYPFITNPPKMHLISDIPDPAAYFAKDLTRWAAINENTPCSRKNVSQPRSFFGRGNEAYSNDDIDHPSHGGVVAPIAPGITRLVSRLDFPTTELLVQPPGIITVPHLEVGEPLGYNRYKGRIYPNTNTYPQSVIL